MLTGKPSVNLPRQATRELQDSITAIRERLRLADAEVNALSSRVAALPTSSGTSGATEVNLGYVAATDRGVVTNSAGNDATIPLFSETRAGLVPAGYDPGDAPQAVTAAASTDIDLSLGSAVAVDMAASITTLTIAAARTAMRALLYLKQDGAGSKTVTWPASVKWAGGSAPTLTTTANRTDVIELSTFDAGTTWFARVVGLDFNA
jgi:hypothetical protein